MDPEITPRSLSSVDGIDLVCWQPQEEISSTASEPQPNIPQGGYGTEINVENFTPTVADVELGDIRTIRDTVQILLGCLKRGETRNKQHPASFCMVPNYLRDLNPSSFNPQIVSIGPLHNNQENVKKFEMQKESYLHDYLSHCLGASAEQTLEACVQVVNSSIPRIRTSYGEYLKKYTDIRLAKMMVIDCCFILEFLHKLPTLSPAFASNVSFDLMLLENQVPFFVLEDILKCTSSESSTFLIEELLNLRNFIDPFFGKLKYRDYVDTYKPHDHILGILHESYIPASSSQNPRRLTEFAQPHTATELHKAGVNFKPHQDESWPMAMNYESSRFMCFCLPWGKPTLSMPSLQIGDATETVLRNFIAYEQSSPVHQYFASYVVAMDMLVRTEEDMEKLVKSKVVNNNLGSNEEAAKLINNISKEVCIMEFSYDQQWKKLDSYYKHYYRSRCRNYWRENIAWLRRTYFNSPWNMIALLAGIVLFALTVVQTIYTIKAT